MQNWVEEAISKEHIKIYKCEQFSNIQKIGSGGSGKVYRANLKNHGQNIALKSFFDFNEATAKEIEHEIRLHRDVHFHDNIIKFYGIAQFDPENQNVQSKNCLLVMEYADSGTLKSYLKKNFNCLTWNDKCRLAYQLACAVSCLHNEKIVHRDLHSSNVLVHQNIVKLSDFGLSKRIESSSNTRSGCFGIIPYIEPKKLLNNQYSLNEKSDIYSIGVLLWEISSGRLPFYNESKEYDVALAIKIVQDLREDPTPDTPKDYIKIYTECWDGEPDNRPTIDQVKERLEVAIARTSVMTENYQTVKFQLLMSDKQEFKTSSSNNTSSNNTSHGDSSQIIQNFNKLNLNEIDLTT
ncbi:hypothetical protein RclHR1_00560019 [Rhizophagus clarus]|uniref:Kinase-like domain-containing protein n=1 Tax=Rhizophagus clarus TaxID=94130 RepID=A0A2Z6S6K0_9GLOM|nr:hypothetical protein RclHR1_00560019 [Rhizophagus clarus]GES99756.1 kinase-like domain-containing protein [Rhizophagus clarus]